MTASDKRKLAETKKRHGYTGFIIVGIPSVLAYLGPLHWTFDLFSPFRLQYTVISLVYLLLCVLWRDYLAVGCYGVLFGLNLHFVIPALVDPVEEQATFDVRVMAHNVNVQNQKVEPVVEQIDVEDPAVVFLLEPRREFFDAIGEHSWSRYRYYYERSDAFSMAIFSKYEMYLTPKVEGGLPFFIVDIEHERGPMRIVGVHAPLPWDQQRRHRNLRKAAIEIADHESPGVIIGDFNMTPYNDHFRKIFDTRDIRCSDRGLGVKPTWPDAPIDFLKIPIDHICINKGFKFAAYRTLDALGSDHNAIVADLILTDR